jgi:hypothetical protein
MRRRSTEPAAGSSANMEPSTRRGLVACARRSRGRDQGRGLAGRGFCIADLRNRHLVGRARYGRQRTIGRNMPEPESEIPPPTPLTGTPRSDPTVKVLSPADGGPVWIPATGCLIEDGEAIVVFEADCAAFDDLEEFTDWASDEVAAARHRGRNSVTPTRRQRRGHARRRLSCGRQRPRAGTSRSCAQPPRFAARPCRGGSRSPAP